jgi:hypothetical protein
VARANLLQGRLDLRQPLGRGGPPKHELSNFFAKTDASRLTAAIVYEKWRKRPERI